MFAIVMGDRKPIPDRKYGESLNKKIFSGKGTDQEKFMYAFQNVFIQDLVFLCFFFSLFFCIFDLIRLKTS